jgi:hypothetical protein
MDQLGGLDDSSVNAKLYLFIGQIVTLFFVVVISLVNLSVGTNEQKLWITLLSISLGCLLPSPKFNTKMSNIGLTRENTTDIKEVV